MNELTASFYRHFAERLAVTRGCGKQRTVRNGSICVSDIIIVLHFHSVIMLILYYLRLPTKKI